MLAKSSDVLIIGAGAAGLAAAAELTREGIRTVVVEARDRLGGRIHTLHLPPFPVPVEMGAQFVHGRPPEIWDIIRREMFPVSELDGDNFCLERNALNKCNDFWSHWERVSKAMNLERGTDEPFVCFLNRLAARENLETDERFIG